MKPEQNTGHPAPEKIPTNARDLLGYLRTSYQFRSPPIDELYFFLRQRPTYDLPITPLTGVSDLKRFIENKYTKRYTAEDYDRNKSFHASIDPRMRQTHDWYKNYRTQFQADLCAFIIVHPKGLIRTPSYVTLGHHVLEDSDRPGVDDADPRYFSSGRVTTFKQFVNYEPDVDFFTRHQLEKAHSTYDRGMTARRNFLSINGEFVFPQRPSPGGDPWIETYVSLDPGQQWESGWQVFGIEGVQVMESAPTEIDIPLIGPIRMQVDKNPGDDSQNS